MAYADGDDTQIADDGTQSADDSAESPIGGQSLAPVERDLGFILDEEDEEKVAKHMVKMREDQRQARSRRRANWQRNAWWREGRRGIRIQKRENSALWEAKMPSGMADTPPMPNKTDRLCRRVTNTILVDPPAPECMPGGDNNEDRDAAEFATRYLKERGSVAALNMQHILDSTMDKGHTYSSAFAWVTMDPMAGGHRPRTVDAHPDAPHMDVATKDPKSGLAADPNSLIKRFVRPDRFLTDNQNDADLQWIPGHKVRIITGLQLDFIPARATGIADANGVVITDTTTLGDLKKQFPDRFDEKSPNALTPDQIKKLCIWRPKDVKDILPVDQKEPEHEKEEDGTFKDSQLVIATTVYYRSCAEYPFGCYAVAGGDTMVLHKQKWSAMLPQQKGEDAEEPLMVPIAQYRDLDDNIRDDPYGIALAEHLGPADEVRNAALGYQIEHMFISANRIPYIPIGSIVQPKAFQRRDGNPIFVAPNGKPEWEIVPEMSPTVPELRGEMTEEMNDESGLQQAGQGVEGPDVKSGIHAQTIVQEALKAIVNLKNNGEFFYIRLNQIILELARAFCSIPDLLSYDGEDGEYKEQEWSRTSFRTTKRVTIAKGSYTMHTLLAKTEMANQALDRKAIDMEEYQDLIAGGVSPIIGMQDNPALMRIRRQLMKWKDGPSPEFLQGMQQLQMQQAAMAAQPPVAGPAPAPGAPPGASPMQPPMQSPAVTPPPAIQQAPAAPTVPTAPASAPQLPPHPFSLRIPADLEPDSAKIRHRQMFRVMNSNRYGDYPQPWRDLFEKEYADMVNAAGIMTVPSIQAAKAQEQATAAAAQKDETDFRRYIEKQRLVVDLDKLALDRNQKPPYPVPPAPTPDGSTSSQQVA